MKKPALLALENGTLFYGESIGIDGISTGEVVFNTSITGYQEIITDPSYARQFVTLTYPHIGNTGTNPVDEEAKNIHMSGLIIRDLPPVVSNWRSQESLTEYLARNKILGISDIDTRKLTRILRDEGAQRGCLMCGEIDADKALAEARNFPGLKGMDLAKEVTASETRTWNKRSWKLEDGTEDAPENSGSSNFNIVAYDFGVKANILRMLVDRGCSVTVVPAKTPAAKVLAMNPDGVFLSNGPGDPEPCDYAISAIKEIVATGKPVFGICLGHQLLGLACGAQTIKMKFGHHGGNHPVLDIDSGRVMISSQNHGFAIDEETLPENVKATHRSLFDQSLQGIHLTDRPAFGFQGHPEASPGPHDVAPLFDHFIDLIKEAN